VSQARQRARNQETPATELVTPAAKYPRHAAENPALPLLALEEPAAQALAKHRAWLALAVRLYGRGGGA
jgi:hypothetical protein